MTGSWNLSDHINIHVSCSRPTKAAYRVRKSTCIIINICDRNGIMKIAWVRKDEVTGSNHHGEVTLLYHHGEVTLSNHHGEVTLLYHHGEVILLYHHGEVTLSYHHGEVTLSYHHSNRCKFQDFVSDPSLHQRLMIFLDQVACNESNMTQCGRKAVNIIRRWDILKWSLSSRKYHTNYEKICVLIEVCFGKILYYLCYS